jgi:hypothetical protein
MFGPRIISFVAAVAVAAPAFAITPRRQLTPRELRDYRAVSYFLKAVDSYVLSHRVVEPVPPDVMCLPDGTVAAIDALAANPIAPPRPREGDIFASDVADAFRDRIAGAIRHYGINVWDLVSDMNEEEVTAPRAEVGEPMPSGVGDDSIAWLTAALPVLPETLEFRLVGRDLVLFDVTDNVVVDTLRVAVPLY